MTRSVYIIGGAGSGKSTFTADLLDGLEFSPPQNLHKTPNARGSIVTLRGHELPHGWSNAGLYLGLMREFYPGTDGLDRASSIAGEEWLQNGGAEDYSFIVSEGATLATRRFMTALDVHTELLLVHLFAEPEVIEKRFAERGSTQDPGFVKNTVTRSRNLLEYVNGLGAVCLSVDTANTTQWDLAQDLCRSHLRS